jgi:small-conductance mechanosensitive channel
MLLESPFKVGDEITVGSSSGKVVSIDLLAIQLRTPEGDIIRVPNETLIKSAITIKK